METDSTNFLGTIYASNVSAVETNKWTKTLSLNQRDILFKIDRGADVTVIPESFYESTHDGPLKSAERSLTGAGQQPLDVQGQFIGHLRSRLTVVSREAKKKQHACASSGPRDHYSELFTRIAALKF